MIRHIEFAENKSGEGSRFLNMNHCLLSAEPFHVIIDPREIKLEFKKSKAWFARYETDIDLNCATEWWHCIKDSAYTLDGLKSKSRCEVRKGIKNFETKIICPKDWEKEIYEIDLRKFAEYPEAYRPHLPKEQKDYLKNHYSEKIGTNARWFGTFSRESGMMGGFAICIERQGMISLDVMGLDPRCINLSPAASLMDCILNYYESLPEVLYISDGARNIRHQTGFQEYLVRHFGFRKVYCRLQLISKKWITPIMWVLYPFKECFLKSSNPFFYNIGCFLKMKKYAIRCARGTSCER